MMSFEGGRARRLGLWLAAALALMAAGPARSETQTLRVGHFPNITHVQGLVAHALSRQGKGWFEGRLPGVAIEWFVYNAGPSAMEAIFAGSIDLTYVGPNPAINAYVKSKGLETRIVAGAAEGGAGLVIQPDLPLSVPADFKGRKIATPQFGNTQDVSARSWLIGGGLTVTQTGGDAQVVPAANPDQLSLFKTKQVDAVWTIEPWVSRLEAEAGGKVLVEDKTSMTTVLVSSAKALTSRRELVAKFAAAHKELTEWIKAHPEEAQKLARDEIDAETHSAVSPELTARAWKRIVITATLSREQLDGFLKGARLAGFLRDTGDIAAIVETP
jgi:NitT/TauT family transport system substrate-binding protein